MITEIQEIIVRFIMTYVYYLPNNKDKFFTDILDFQSLLLQF